LKNKMQKNTKTEKDIISILRSGGVGVLPTDTLYGLIGSALRKETVERIYKLRKRELKKPMIILISSLNDLKKFGIKLNAKQKKPVSQLWPEKVSIVFDCFSEKFEYLHRGKQTLAFRLPQYKWLRDILDKTGPLVAPSANIAGEKPSETYSEARKYFKNEVNFYVDAGKIKSKPSTLVKIERSGEIKILRQGAFKIKKSN